MKKSILLFLAILPGMFSFGQRLRCDAETANRAEIARIHQQRQANPAYLGLTPYPDRSIALFMHIIVVDNTPTSTPGQLQVMVDEANQYFAPVNMHFTICGFDYVFLGPNQSGWGPGFMTFLQNNYYHDGYINVYTTDYIPFAGGVATFPSPGSPDMIIITGDFFVPAVTDHDRGGVLAHELGHIFSLVHTFSNMAGPVATDELVDGSNCSIAGDFICDTPADPGLTAVPNRVDSLCNYTDTIYTDANGDLFQPDTRNIMSFAPYPCYDHFSNEQLLQMRYCLDHLRYYLRSGSLNMVLTNPERRMCIYDADITLNPVPPGGTFSGPGVNGNIFSPAAAGGGNHLITYTLPGISDTVSSTDQFCTYPDTSISLTLCSQTFSSSITADLTGISVYLNNPIAQQVIIRVYQGPAGGTLLVQDTVAIPGDTLTRWFDLPFDTAAPVQNGSWYTFSLEFATAAEIYGSYSNRYNGGQGDSLTDFAFVTHINTYEPNCGNNAYIGFSVIAPNKPGFEDFVPTLCISSPAVTLQGRPSGGDMSINFSPDSVFIPAAFGLGMHAISYMVTDRYGCQSDTLAFITVQDDNVTIDPLNSTYCPDEVTTPVTGSPAGGNFYLDGSPLAGNQIDFSQLSIGLHTLSYAYRDSLPYFNQTDVNTLDSISTNSLPTSNSLPIYQSFKAGISGYLNRIYIRYSSNDTTRALLRIFQGADTTGTLLYSDSVSIGGVGWYNSDMWLQRDQVWLLKDSSYTFCIQTNYQGSGGHGNIYLSTTDIYPDGTNNLALSFPPFTERDLYFVTYMDPLYTCANDSVSAVFNISQPIPVNLGNDTTLFTGQFLLLDGGFGGVSYNWSNGSTTQVILVSTSGTYSVVTTNGDGCTSSDTVVVNFIVSVDETLNGALQVQPNPVSGSFLLHYTGTAPIEQMVLVDLHGRQLDLRQTSGQSNRYQFDVSGLSPGVYFLHIQTATGNGVVRVVVE